ncbi:MAG TPA: hypothetical protein DEF51_36520 [Myxococcales bacterium]|nr:hypothetical protein [Myxococcales bacterium]
MRAAAIVSLALLSACHPRVRRHENYRLPMSEQTVARIASGDGLVSYLRQADADPAVCAPREYGPYVVLPNQRELEDLVDGIGRGVRVEPWEACVQALLRVLPPSLGAHVVNRLLERYAERIAYSELERDGEILAQLDAIRRLYDERPAGTSPSPELIAEIEDRLRAAAPHTTHTGSQYHAALMSVLYLEHGLTPSGAPITEAALDRLVEESDEGSLVVYSRRLPDPALREEARRRLVRVRIRLSEFTELRAQAAEVDIIITTALIPGKKAPLLVPEDVVEALKPGSVVVDLAAERGGNCALSKPDEVVDHGGVKIIGYTDLVSRMGSSASRFFGANVANLLKLLVKDGALAFDLEDEVVRAATLVHEGEVLPTPEPPKPPPAEGRKSHTHHRPDNAAQERIMSPTRRAWGTTVGGMLVVLLLFVLGRFAPSDFLQHLTVFVLACFVGWQVIWSVTPALHTPLMSVTNAISGIIIVGGMLQVGSGELDLAAILGAVAVLVAAVNISGGFLVTQRMLAMFHRDEPSEEKRS